MPPRHWFLDGGRHTALPPASVEMAPCFLTPPRVLFDSGQDPSVYQRRELLSTMSYSVLALWEQCTVTRTALVLPGFLSLLGGCGVRAASPQTLPRVRLLVWETSLAQFSAYKSCLLWEWYLCTQSSR